jgi:hypothetical protein
MRVAAILFENPPPSLIPFAEACLRFSPQLCLKRPGILFIEIGKCRLLYREDTFLARLQLVLERFHLKARVALADSLLESLVLARYGTLDFKSLKMGCLLDYIDPFQSDLNAFKTAENLVDKLRQLGIKTVHQFLAIPASELSWRFGAWGILLRSRLLKETDVGWPLWTPTEEISEKIELDDFQQCSGIESLLFYLKPMVERIFSRIKGRGLRVSVIKLTFFLEKFSAIKEPTKEWRIEFIFPQSTAKETLLVIRERLEKDLSKKSLESVVLAIDFKVLQTVNAQRGQKNFFHSREENEERFNSALSQLVEGLGKENVFRVALHEDAVPERSWSKTFIDQKVTPDLNDYIPPRPTKLLGKPERVELAKDLIFIRKRGYRILRWSCVEEIATHWIDEQNAVIRSYYRLDLEGKPPVWIFKSVQNDYYFHGYFG